MGWHRAAMTKWCSNPKCGRLGLKCYVWTVIEEAVVPIVVLVGILVAVLASVLP